MAVGNASTCNPFMQEYDPRFTAPPEEVPWGSIALALFLTVFGLLSFVLAWLHFTQVLFGKEQAVGSC